MLTSVSVRVRVRVRLRLRLRLRLKVRFRVSGHAITAPSSFCVCLAVLMLV